MTKTGRPRLLVISHVLPFPNRSGQQQRVFHTVRSAQEIFDVSFLTSAPSKEREELKTKLERYVDEAIIIPSRYGIGLLAKARHGVAGSLHSARTGLKKSNYVIGEVNFTAAQIAGACEGREFDCVLFEYWHAWKATEVFQCRDIPCVLDMHDVLWRPYEAQLRRRKVLPSWWRRRAVVQYRSHEEVALARFDGVIAINREEERYVREITGKGTRVWHAAMGVDTNKWAYAWTPSEPKRIAFYGGITSARNRDAALTCVRRIMPIIWKRHPATELWLVGRAGNRLPLDVRRDRRIRVTGYLRDPQELLGTMWAVCCPWTGKYGFRSRLIEVMAVGVPVVVSADAIFGMDLVHERGTLVGLNDEDLAELTIRLLEDRDFASRQSELARREVEAKFDLQSTYGTLMNQISEWLGLQAATSQ